MFSTAPLAAAPASATAGSVPPTASASGVTVPVLASTRKVCTPTSPDAEPPLRFDCTVAPTTRTW